MSIYEYGVATGRLGSLDNARTPYKTTEQIAFQSPIRNHPAVIPTQLRVRKPYHLWGLVPLYGRVSTINLWGAFTGYSPSTVQRVCTFVEMVFKHIVKYVSDPTPGSTTIV